MCRNKMNILNKMCDLKYIPMQFCNPCFNRDADYKLRNARAGFTIVEIMIVVVILSIAALAAIPMLSSASSFQIRSAANMIAADLEYAKSMAISRGQTYTVKFNESTDSYSIVDQTDTVIEHPVKKGFPYTVNFPTESRLSKVDITNVTFTSDMIGFDCLGSPDNDGGSITIDASGFTATINVEPVTGYITINL